jgi:hypothetical protein
MWAIHETHSEAVGRGLEALCLYGYVYTSQLAETYRELLCGKLMLRLRLFSVEFYIYCGFLFVSGNCSRTISEHHFCYRYKIALLE